MQKYLAEISNHDRFLKLCEEIVEVNERICDRRPVSQVKEEKELSELKKKLQRRFMKKYRPRWSAS